MHAFLQQLGAAPVVLAGKSMGGWIASAYARRYPDTLRALWLLAPLGVADCHSSDLLDAIERGSQAVLQFRQVMASGEALEAIVGRLRLPIHLQWGRADHAVDPGGAQALLQARPEIDLQMFEGLGHLPMLEAPRKSAEHFLRFCQNQDILH